MYGMQNISLRGETMAKSLQDSRCRNCGKFYNYDTYYGICPTGACYNRKGDDYEQLHTNEGAPPCLAFGHQTQSLVGELNPKQTKKLSLVIDE